MLTTRMIPVALYARKLAIYRQMLEASSNKSWIKCHEARTAASEIRLFCFHHAGGNAAVYNNWKLLLPKWIGVCAVELPGRGKGLFSEIRYTCLDSLIDELVPMLEPWLDRPYAFFGHSLGALIVFAMTGRLVQMVAPLPKHLFLSSYRAAHLLPTHLRLSSAPSVDLIAFLREMAGTPFALLEDKQICELLLPVLRDDLQIAESWDRSDLRPVPCGISAFGGDQDLNIQTEDLMAWAKHTSANFHCQLFPGGHFYINESEKALLSEMQKTLAMFRSYHDR